MENLIYLIVFSLPLYLIRKQVLFLHTNGLEILISIALVWWLVVFFRYAKIKSFCLEYEKYLICGALMLAGFFWSAGANGQMLQSLSIIKSWFLFPLALMLVAADVIPRERLKNIFLVYAVSTLAVAAVALPYLFLGQLTYDGRLMAFFNSPNYLAMYLAPGVIIYSWALLRAGHRKKNLLALSVLLVVLFFTYSYAAYAAIFLSELFVLRAGRWDDGIKKIFSKELVALCLVIFMFFVFQVNNKKFNDLLALDPRSSLSSRVMIWKAALRMAEDRPVVGIGAANFQETYLSYQKFFPPYLEWAVPHPQNIFLTFWLFGGVLGILGFLGLLFFFFRDLFKKKSQNSLEILAFGLMLYILFHGLFDTTYFKNDLAIVFWLNFLVLKKTDEDQMASL